MGTYGWQSVMLHLGTPPSRQTEFLPNEEVQSAMGVRELYLPWVLLFFLDTTSQEETD